jgi:mRNA-degrading endonuclease RelE of RelBE toxin-antitoxin system
MNRVLDAIDRLCAGESVGDVRRLTGRPEHRLRVGDWRVLFVRDDERRTVRVLRVLPRGRAYDR